MNISFEKRGFRPILWRYSLLYLFFIVCYFTIFGLTGHTLIWQLDAAQQHVQVLQAFHTSFWEWMHHLSQGPQMWSWKLGLGADTFALNSYYCLGDIFSYPALFVPTTFIPQMFGILIFLRLYCVGLAIAYFLNHFNFKPATILAGTAAYMGSNYLLYSTISQPFFLTPLMQFPLLLLAYHAFIKEKRWVPLLLMLTWIFVNSFYFAFIIGVGFALYLLLEKFSTQQSWADWSKKLCQTAFITINAVFLSCVMLIPELIAMSQSTRSADKQFANGIWLYPFEYYAKLSSQFIGIKGAGYWTSLGYLMPLVFAIIYIFIHKKEFRLLANSFIFAGIAALFPAIAAIFNAASSPSNRWLFMLLTPLALALCIFIERFATLTKTEIATIKKWALGYTVLFVIFAILGVIAGFIQRNSTIVTALLWFITLEIFWYLTDANAAFKNAQKWLVGLTVVNMGVNAFCYTSPLFKNYVSQTITANGYKNDTTNVYAGLDKNLTPSNHYRVSTLAYNYYVANGVRLFNALGNKMNATFSYYSVMANSLATFSKAYGNLQYTPNMPIQEVDNRTILQNYLGVKYLFGQANKANRKKVGAGYKLTATTTKNNKTYRRYTTSNNYPLLWWTNNYQTQSQNQKLSYAQREYMLSQAVVLPDSTNTTNLTNKSLPSNAVNKVDYYIVDNNGKKVSSSQITKSSTSQYYRIVIKNPGKYKTSQLNVELTGISYSAKNLVNSFGQFTTDVTANSSTAKSNAQKLINNTQFAPGYKIKISGSKGTTTVAQAGSASLSQRIVVQNAALNLGYFKTQLPKSLKLKFSSLGTYKFNLNIYAVNLGANYKKAVKQIKQSSLKNIKFSTNTVTAKLTHQTPGIVTSSIPYASGWHAYIDGKPVATIETNYGMLGFKVPAGSHNITLKYETPGLKLGLIISLVSLLATIGGGIWFARKKKHN